ncbi:hypothetical protein F4776DRAFT_668592 [Hypoxylon sp. NC0597]|nr:hypothetical protein F4776DRAFT_668592 [Hypoxylon sp. NC0597]
MPDTRYTSSSPSSVSDPRSTPGSRRKSFSENSQPPRQRGSSPTHSGDGKNALKTSLIFLGVVGAASVAASKYWPKGIIYGEKESWAQEVKKEVKNIVRGDGSSSSVEQRSRSREARHNNPNTRRGLPPRVDIRDEVVVRRPDGRSMYVNTGWFRCPDDGGSDRGRRRIIDRRGGRRFGESPYGT